MPGTSSISGIISGLDTQSIVSQLMELARGPVTRMETRKTSLSNQITAWQDANTRILALKTKAGALATASTFDAKTATSSDESIVTGTATYSAQAGSYYLTVNSLARAHQLKTEGYANTTSTVGTGTISIAVGSGAAKDIVIDDTNNSLIGVRDAINRSGAGVTATIINDGSAGNPYRLIITSDTSGVAGRLTITTSPTLFGGVAPTTLQTGEDASITLGAGADAITVSKGSNQITDLVPGVTLDLQRADAGKVITITIGNDSASIKQAIKDFVEQYNNLIGFINEQFKYDTKTNIGGTLFGNPTLRLIQSELTGRVFNTVTGLNQSIVVLSQIGITSTTGNKLSLNEADLDSALASSLSQVKGLFAAVGEATSSNVAYVASTINTKASGEAGYAIEITAVASQARVTSGVAQTDVLAQDEQLTINGKVIQLTAGMTGDQVLQAINAMSSQTGVLALRTDINGQGTGDYLSLTRIAYGSARTITAISSVSSALGNTSGLGNVTVTQASPTGESGSGTGAAGTDVAGTINGEAATGSGQVLTGNEGNENTDGLALLVTAQTPGSYGTIAYSKGLAASLSEYLGSISEPVTGTIVGTEDSLNSQIKYINDDIASMNARLAVKEEQLYRQFAAMESALSKLQSQGSYLTSQIEQLSNNWKK
ncbi:MAG TPA: flagellar filament capping protein FliD [Armatimonadota bacterium]|nr:flagellar filament capping protein FliD [Armatimonadota bacterium]